MKKILFNLHSEQTIPNYIAIEVYKPNKVIALSTKEFKNQYLAFEKTTNIKHFPKEIDAYSFDENYKFLKTLIEELGDNNEIIVNYTGGTKIMTISVIISLLLSSNQKITFSYINTKDNAIEVLELSEGKQITTSKSKIDIVIPLDVYVQLKGEKIQSQVRILSSNIEERIYLTKMLLGDNEIRSIFKKQKQFFDKNNELKTEYQFTNSKFELSWCSQSFSFKTEKKSYFYNHPDGGKYFSGEWLEEFVFFSLCKSDLFDKIVANVKFEYTSENAINRMKTNNKDFFKNEIDVVVTSGLKTAFIECKAGYVSQDYVYKLKSIRDHFLGTFGIAILVTMFPQEQNIVEKCKDFNIVLISAGKIPRIVNALNDILNK